MYYTELCILKFLLNFEFPDHLGRCNDYNSCIQFLICDYIHINGTFFQSKNKSNKNAFQ